MNFYRPTKDALDFGEIKNQISTIDSKIKAKQMSLIEGHGEDNVTNEEINNLKKQAVVLNDLLQKEPPMPELPPSGTLIKVMGLLEDIDILFTRGFFTDREYQPETFAKQEVLRQWGSVIQAALGDSAAASINAQNETRKSHAYDYVRGRINGKDFYGWLGYCTAIKGDYVELAVIDKGTHYEVYALIIPTLKTITTIPCCSHGVIGKAKSDLFGTFIFVAAVILLLFMLSILWTHSIVDTLKLMSVIFIALVSVTAIFSFSFYLKSLNKPKPTTKLAQSIFSTLNLPDPEKINLNQRTKKRLKNVNKMPVPSDGRVMPCKNSYIRYYFYY